MKLKKKITFFKLKSNQNAPYIYIYSFYFRQTNCWMELSALTLFFFFNFKALFHLLEAIEILLHMI